MTTWKFSDGTIVRLGGDVEGGSLLAQELREYMPRVTEVPAPIGSAHEEAFNMNDPRHVALYLQQAVAEHGGDVKIIQGPEALPVTVEDVDPDVLY